MKKGRFGVSLTAIAAIAFLFTALRQPQSVLLVAGFALLAEKDEWLNRQVLQALLLTIAYYLAHGLDRPGGRNSLATWSLYNPEILMSGIPFGTYLYSPNIFTVQPL